MGVSINKPEPNKDRIVGNDPLDLDEEYELEQSKKTFCQQYFVINPEKSSFKAYWDAFIYFGLAFNYFL
jgi:hypothetical protein